MVFESYSEEETYKIAKNLAVTALPGQVYALIGDLGVGKTCFARGFATGLGIEGPIVSPTFTLVQEYDGGRLPFYHFDVYRLDGSEDMEALGYEDYFYGEGITFIEWANRVQSVMPKETYWIEIKKCIEKGYDYRIIEIKQEFMG